MTANDDQDVRSQMIADAARAFPGRKPAELEKEFDEMDTLFKEVRDTGDALPDGRQYRLHELTFQFFIAPYAPKNNP